jgi:acyl-CoA synthetase (NDP forming)
MGKLVARTAKPIVMHSLYSFAKPHALELLRYYGIPVHDSLDIACRCIAVLGQYGHYLGTYATRTNFVFGWGARARREGKRIIAGALGDSRHVLLENEARELLRLHGAPVSRSRLAKTADDAAEAAASMNGAVAMKVVSPDILHKSEAGGVKLNLRTEREVRKAFSDILRSAKKHSPDAEIRGCLVSPMASPGAEVIIGTKIDEQFGPVIMFGLGGILVEVIRDVSFRVLPISRRAARKMIAEPRTAKILEGIRGKPPLDKDALCSLLLTVSEVVESYPEIREMDLNPVIVHERGASVVDARILLKKNCR